MSRSKLLGFTLIELSIILVIIGLVIGGILIGRDIIRAAEIRSVISDVEKYNAAINAFRTKYNALPGDMKNASDLWGLSTNCPRDTGPGTATCNGDGDGRVCGVGIYAAIGGCFTEGLYLWQHLAYAELINGKYDAASPGPYWRLNANFPGSKAFPNAGYTVVFHGPWTGGIDQFFITNTLLNHVIAFGGYAGASGPSNWMDNPFYPVLSTKEALALDQKIDDGKPGTGNVVALPKAANFNPACATGDYTQSASALYDQSQTGAQCALFFGSTF